MKAGIRKRSAKTQAVGSPKHTAQNPHMGTATRLTRIRAIISETPENMANRVYPAPWMEYLKIHNRPNSGKNDADTCRNNAVSAMLSV